MENENLVWVAVDDDRGKHLVHEIKSPIDTFEELLGKLSEEEKSELYEKIKEMYLCTGYITEIIKYRHHLGLVD